MLDTEKNEPPHPNFVTSVTSVVLAKKCGISKGCGRDRSDKGDKGDKPASLLRAYQKFGALGALLCWLGKRGISMGYGLKPRAKTGAKLIPLARAKDRDLPTCTTL